jgi:hypothetical protein
MDPTVRQGGLQDVGNETSITVTPGSNDVTPSVGHDLLALVVFFDYVENRFNIGEITFDRDIVLPWPE